MAEGTAVIDRGLPALRAVMADELCTAILAMRQSSALIFASTEPPPARGSLDSRDRCVTEENFCRFIGHIRGEVTKRFSLRRLHRNSRPVWAARSMLKLWVDQSNCLMTRSRAAALQLFRTKSSDHLIAEDRIPLESLWIESFGQGACFGRECSIPDHRTLS